MHVSQLALAAALVVGTVVVLLQAGVLLRETARDASDNDDHAVAPDGALREAVAWADERNAHLDDSLPRTRRAYLVVAADRGHWLHCFRLAHNLQARGARLLTLCGTVEPVRTVTPLDAALAAQLNMEFVHFDPFWSPQNVHAGWAEKRGSWRKAWEKLNALLMFDYEAVMVIDTDTAVVRAPDEALFAVGRESPLAFTYGMDSCDFPWEPNTGVFVVHPLRRVVRSLIRYLSTPCGEREGAPNCPALFHSADQSALGWWAKQPDVIRDVFDGRPPHVLSHIYNMVSFFCDCKSYRNAIHLTSIWHFTVGKPWDQDEAQPDPPCVSNALAIYHSSRRAVIAMAHALAPQFSSNASALLDFPQLP